MSVSGPGDLEEVAQRLHAPLLALARRIEAAVRRETLPR
jgi:hypothetical protein